METLPPERIDDDRPTTAITLAQCRRSLDRDKQVMSLSLMIMEVNDFFNVKGSMTAKQIKLTAELILDNPGFHDLTLGNIKACFRQCMTSEKIYDRIDGNLIISWLRRFKSDLADHCETVAISRERQRQRDESLGDAGAITHAAYLAMLEARAGDGDEDARQTLDDYRRRSHTLTPEQQRQKEIEFRLFKHRYNETRKKKED